MVNKGNIFPLQVKGSYLWSSDRDGEGDYRVFYDWKVFGGVDGGIIATISMAQVTIPYEELVAVEQNNQN